MGIKQNIFHFIAGLFIERPAKKRTFEQFVSSLNEVGKTVTERIAKGDETEANSKLIRHIIGIERWGQRRLKVALGEPLLLDEYDGYQPEAGMKVKKLQEVFQTTRHETIYLAQQFATRAIDPNTTVKHNNFGELTLRGWLQYLQGHAKRESRNIKEKTS